jgi:hypothetical protein
MCDTIVDDIISLEKICPKCSWLCKHYTDHGWCHCSPYNERPTHVRDIEKKIPIIIVKCELRKLECNIVIDGDNFMQSIVFSLVDYFMTITTGKIIVVVSPYRYISIIGDRFTDEIKNKFIELIKRKHILIIPKEYYVPKWGCEDAIIMHIARYHHAIILTNDTFKPKHGEKHLLYDEIKDIVLNTKCSTIDDVIELTFCKFDIELEKSEDVLDFVINCLNKLNASDICTEMVVDKCIYRVIINHEIFNIQELLISNDWTISFRTNKLLEYSIKLKHAKDLEYIEMLKTKTKDSEQLLAIAREKDIQLNARLSKLLTI